MRIWDAATRRQRAVLTGHTVGVAAVAVSPDGRGSPPPGRPDGADLGHGDLAQHTPSLTRAIPVPVAAVAVAPDGRWLASVGQGQDGADLGSCYRKSSALMRAENRLSACTWLGITTLAIGGAAGLYQFRLIAVTSSGAP